MAKRTWEQPIGEEVYVGSMTDEEKALYALTEKTITAIIDAARKSSLTPSEAIGVICNGAIRTLAFFMLSPYDKEMGGTLEMNDEVAKEYRMFFNEICMGNVDAVLAQAQGHSVEDYFRERADMELAKRGPLN